MPVDLEQELLTLIDDQAIEVPTSYTESQLVGALRRAFTKAGHDWSVLHQDHIRLLTARAREVLEETWGYVCVPQED